MTTDTVAQTTPTEEDLAEMRCDDIERRQRRVTQDAEHLERSPEWRSDEPYFSRQDELDRLNREWDALEVQRREAVDELMAVRAGVELAQAA